MSMYMSVSSWLVSNNCFSASVYWVKKKRKMAELICLYNLVTNFIAVRKIMVLADCSPQVRVCW